MNKDFLDGLRMAQAAGAAIPGTAEHALASSYEDEGGRVTAHDHTEYVVGCFRCEFGLDELDPPGTDGPS